MTQTRNRFRRGTPVRREDSPPSLPFESLLEASDSHVEDAGLDNALVIGADEGQVVVCQFERDLAALAGLEQNFREALEPFQRRRYARNAFVQVQLNDFLAAAAAAVFHRHVHAHGLVPRSRGRCNVQIGIGESPIAQPRSEFDLRRAHHFPFPSILPSQYSSSFSTASDTLSRLL